MLFFESFDESVKTRKLSCAEISALQQVRDKSKIAKSIFKNERLILFLPTTLFHVHNSKYKSIVVGVVLIS